MISSVKAEDKMNYLTIREDINVHGTVNENVNVWDHRPADTSLGWGSLIGIGFGVLAIASLFFKEKSNQTKCVPTPVPDLILTHKSKI